jgi:ribosomal protein S18
MPKSTFQRKPKRKFCQFCADKQDYIDYKDVNLLRKFMSDRGKIRARRVTGNCTSATSPPPSRTHGRWPCSPTPSDDRVRVLRMKELKSWDPSGPEAARGPDHKEHRR